MSTCIIFLQAVHKLKSLVAIEKIFHSLTARHLKTVEFVAWRDFLFLPAAGYCDDSDLNDAGDYGNYWSRSLYTDSPNNAWYLYFEDGDFNTDNNNRYNGQSVRPVLVVAE